MTCFFPFSHFFVDIFQFYLVSPQMLTPNSILFMHAFEAVCWGWRFRPSVNLFNSPFKILKSNNGFWNSNGCISLSIFTGHKDFICHWIKSFLLSVWGESGVRVSPYIGRMLILHVIFSPVYLNGSNCILLVWLFFSCKYDVFNCL